MACIRPIWRPNDNVIVRIVEKNTWMGAEYAKQDHVLYLFVQEDYNDP